MQVLLSEQPNEQSEKSLKQDDQSEKSTKSKNTEKEGTNLPTNELRSLLGQNEKGEEEEEANKDENSAKQPNIIEEMLKNAASDQADNSDLSLVSHKSKQSEKVEPKLTDDTLKSLQAQETNQQK